VLIILGSGVIYAQSVPAPPWMNLPEALEQITWGGIARWQWIALGLLLLAAWFVGHIARLIITGAFRWRYRGVEANVSEASGKGVRRGLVWLAATGLWWVVLPELALEPHFESRVRMVLQLLTILGFLWLAYSIWDAVCDALASRAHIMGSRAERLLVPVTRKFVRTLIVLAGALIALGVMGVNVSGILAGVGIGGLVVALAAKDSVENIFGSFTILFDMPFAIGDWVKIGPIEGHVEEINLRSTRVRTGEDSVITLPNSNLIKASVENLGVRRYRRLRFTFGVSYATESKSVEALCDAIRGMLQAHVAVRRDGIQVVVAELGDASIRVLVEAGLKAGGYSDELRLKSEILLAINELAKNLGVQLQGAPLPPPPTPPKSDPGIAEPAKVGEDSPTID
jgi:MscS family membrane protein